MTVDDEPRLWGKEVLRELSNLLRDRDAPLELQSASFSEIDSFIRITYWTRSGDGFVAPDARIIGRLLPLPDEDWAVGPLVAAEDLAHTLRSQFQESQRNAAEPDISGVSWVEDWDRTIPASGGNKQQAMESLSFEEFQAVVRERGLS